MKNYTKSAILFLLLIVSTISYGQLGFCTGSKGEPVFKENFGSGLNYGPQLPFGTTNYTYVNSGFPQDGQYTLFHRTNLIPNNWHFSLDRTPDNEVDGIEGKSLIVNASFTTGEFYKRTVTGLCVNTTFEFSAWVMNIYNAASNSCSGTGIPINISFEIWNDTQTTLLQSGNTGNIAGTSSPIWRQFGLVFTTSNQTSVILIMKNNGSGGCGNDLAIDDIMFRSCGELTTVSSSAVTGNNYNVCPENSPVNIPLQVFTTGTANYFYQWQESTDTINWVNIAGANLSTYNATGITSQRYFRTKVAQDVANLNNSFCSTLSDVFTISFLPSPTAPINTGNSTICSNQAFPALAVTANPNLIVNWYDSITGGNLLASNSLTYTPSSAGTFYAETVSIGNNCRSSTRTPVTLTILPTPIALIVGATNVNTICSGDNFTVTINGTPIATVVYAINNGANQSLILDANGSNSILLTNLTVNTEVILLSVTSAGSPSCSMSISNSINIGVIQTPVATISSTNSICSGSNAVINFNGTPNATVNYTINGGTIQTQILDSLGTASLLVTNLSTNTTYNLVSVTLSGCTSLLTNSVTITVTPSPTATISGTTTVCSGSNATVTINGTPNATVVYTVNNGTNQTQILDALGTASILAANLTTNTTFTLVSVTAAGGAGCTSLLSNSVTITVISSPVATISGTTIICSGSNATITINGTPNATVLYTVNGGANQTQILNATGSASILATNLTVDTTYTLVSVTATGSSGCTSTVSNSVTITVTPAPSASISGPTTVCSGNNATVTINGTPNATVSFTINSGTNQTRILDATGISSIIVTNITSNTTISLVNVTAAGGAGCVQSLSQSIVITAIQAPTANYTGLINYCSGATTTISLVGIVGTTFSWTIIQNGASGASNGSGNLISQQLSAIGNVGNVIYTVTPSLNGCNGVPLIIPITINPLPNPTIRDGIICIDNSTNLAINPYILNTNLNTTSHTFNWYLNGNLIPTAFNNSLSVTQIGNYGVVATNTSTGCISQQANAIVTGNTQADSLTISQSAAFSDNNTITITVNGGIGPFLYQLNDGPYQSSNIFDNVYFGSQTVNVIDALGCTNLSTTVTIINYPHYFTPNDDGINDIWNIKGLAINSKIYIYDRYGKLLKQLQSNGEGWDGTFNGRKMFADDYWFSINYIESGVEKIFKSHFTLKR